MPVRPMRPRNPCFGLFLCVSCCCTWIHKVQLRLGSSLMLYMKDLNGRTCGSATTVASLYRQSRKSPILYPDNPVGVLLGKLPPSIDEFQVVIILPIGFGYLSSGVTWHRQMKSYLFLDHQVCMRLDNQFPGFWLEMHSS